MQRVFARWSQIVKQQRYPNTISRSSHSTPCGGSGAPIIPTELSKIMPWPEREEENSAQKL